MEEGDLVLCTVKNIAGTTVFVTIEDNGIASITTSEIAPGRIRNLREYVIPGKRIVCKVLKIDSNKNIYLSLRRVSGKEKKEVQDKYEMEKTCFSIIKSVVKEKALEITEKIKETGSLKEFLQACKEKPKELEKFFTKEESERLCKIIQEKKEAHVTVNKKFFLSSKDSDGLIRVKNILGDQNIIYIGAGNYGIKVTSSDYKKANSELNKILEEIEALAKKNKAEFQLK